MAAENASNPPGEDEARLADLLEQWEEVVAQKMNYSLEAFLAEFCAGESRLARRFVDLLAAEKWGRQLVNRANEAEADSTKPATEAAAKSGTRIGHYKLLQQLGTGGMGEVWMAEQEKPVRRRVALKFIRDGRGSGMFLARFEQERQALAMMDHPNIAKVLDAGKTADDGPYFVMELVKGVPITKYCDDERLSPRERLELFLPVCEAVQHAHQKGVIHRDLKPSNVLVALYDGRPVPKVIDFGVSKATQQKLTDRTLFTEVGMIVGTLEYMAPEQAELNNLDIDTRADVYALGVMLYELLTGSLPFSSRDLRSVGRDEMLRLIRDVDPPRPSTRLSSTEELAAIAVHRKLQPKALANLVRGELDWIVMKCLEKERQRRYETANALAVDLARYLADEPVQASPPSVTYRLRKFARKHRGPLLAATLVLSTIIVGAVVSVWLALVAHDAQITAQSATKKLNDSLITEIAAHKEAKEQQTKAKESAWLESVQRHKAEEQEALALIRLYGVLLGSAKREWEFENLGNARYQLNRCPKPLRGWDFNYLTTLLQSNQHVMSRQRDEVYSVAFSPDGKRIACGTGCRIQRLRGVGHQSLVDRNGIPSVINGNVDGYIGVIDVDNGDTILDLFGHIGTVTSVVFSKDGTQIVSGGKDATIRIWNAVSGKDILTFIAKSPVVGIALTPDGKRIASAGADGNVRVWDTITGSELLNVAVLHGDNGDISECVSFSPDGTQMATNGPDSTVIVLDSTSGKILRKFVGHTSKVHSIAFSSDSRRIMGASKDALIVWSTDTGMEILNVSDRTREIYRAAFSPDGTRVAFGDTGGVICVRRIGDGDESLRVPAHVGVVLGMAFSADGKWIVSGGIDQDVREWDVTKMKSDMTLPGSSPCFSPDNKWIATAQGKNIAICNVHTGTEVTMVATNGDVTCLDFSPSCKRLVFGSGDNSIAVWDLEAGAEALRLRGHTKGVTSISITPNGKYIVSGSADETIRVWNAITGESIRTIRSEIGGINCIDVSPDGQKIVGGGTIPTITIWDLHTGDVVHRLEGHRFRRARVDPLDWSNGLEFPNGVWSVAFSRDGKQIVSGGDDSSLRLWDATSGTNTWAVRGHPEGVRSVAFSAEGDRIATGGMDGVVKVWDCKTGEETLTLRGGKEAVRRLTFSPDGNLLASGAGYSVVVWDGTKRAQ